MKKAMPWWLTPLPRHLRILALLNAVALVLVLYIWSGLAAAMIMALPGWLAVTVVLKCSQEICRSRVEVRLLIQQLQAAEQELAEQVDKSSSQMRRNQELDRQINSQNRQIKRLEQEIRRLSGTGNPGGDHPASS